MIFVQIEVKVLKRIMTDLKKRIAGIGKIIRIIAMVPVILKVIEVIIDSLAIAKRNLADNDWTVN